MCVIPTYSTSCPNTIYRFPYFCSAPTCFRLFANTVKGPGPAYCTHTAVKATQAKSMAQCVSRLLLQSYCSRAGRQSGWRHTPVWLCGRVSRLKRLSCAIRLSFLFSIKYCLTLMVVRKRKKPEYTRQSTCHVTRRDSVLVHLD